jgi:hypothetical protein
VCTLFLSLWSTRVHDRTFSFFFSSTVVPKACSLYPSSPPCVSSTPAVLILTLLLPQPSPPQQPRTSTSTSPEPFPPSRSAPTNDDIEAVIKMATSSHPSIDRPLRDTRTQLFVGNVRALFPPRPPAHPSRLAPLSRPLAGPQRSLSPCRNRPSCRRVPRTR